MVYMTLKANTELKNGKQKQIILCAKGIRFKLNTTLEKDLNSYMCYYFRFASEAMGKHHTTHHTTPHHTTPCF